MLNGIGIGVNLGFVSFWWNQLYGLIEKQFLAKFTPMNHFGSFKFLPYQLSMVVYWTTMAVTGNGELGFDSGEGAWETATTSKEGSRRVNYPILTQGGSDKK